jgi:hypothetical protein
MREGEIPEQEDPEVVAPEVDQDSQRGAMYYPTRQDVRRRNQVGAYSFPFSLLSLSFQQDWDYDGRSIPSHRFPRSKV